MCNTSRNVLTERITSASYLDLLLSIERNGQPNTCIVYKRDDFNFYIYSPKKVTHNILVYSQVQIIVAATCVLYIIYVIEYKE